LEGGRTGARPSAVAKLSIVIMTVSPGFEMSLDSVSGTWRPLILIRPPMTSDEKAFDGYRAAAQKQVSPN
jgi:hypothetical protein